MFSYSKVFKYPYWEYRFSVALGISNKKTIIEYVATEIMLKIAILFSKGLAKIKFFRINNIIPNSIRLVIISNSKFDSTQ